MRFAGLSVAGRLGEHRRCEQAFDVSEEGDQSIRFGNNGGNAESGGELLAQDVAKHRVHNQGSVWQLTAKERGGLDAIHVRHGKVKDNEIRVKGSGFVDGFGAVRSLATDFIRGAIFEEDTNRIAYGNFVLDDEDAFGHEQRGR